MAARVLFDPVRFPRRYSRPDDVELVALVSACLAYGRAELFGPKLETLWQRIGPHPGEFARNLDPKRERAVFADLSYRFNTPADLAALLVAAGRIQTEHGSLGAVLGESYQRRGELHPALAEFASKLRTRADSKSVAAIGPTRSVAHLLPDPERGGACKRLLLLARWMVRGGPADPVDLGLWRGVPASALVMPLDTHIARISLCLGLTRRQDLSWATAEDVTASLRKVDRDDPVRYDFALCHRGMSGACPRRKSAESCGSCVLAPECRG